MEKCMSLNRVAKLARFLAEGEKSTEQVAKFLVLNTFADLAANTLYITEIVDDGYLSPIGSFGFNKSLVAEWGRFPLTLHVPITQAVHQDECVIVRSIEDLYAHYPVTKEIKNLHTEWVSGISFPMQTLGAVSLTLNQQLTEGEDFFDFIRTIGAMLALELSKVPVYKGSKANGGKNKNGNQHIELSERQKIIHELMFKGFTNAQIAAEVGYSESLVRQETIHIFRVLGVSGRKELIESPPPRARSGGSTA
jgi:DNA-binding CsgD family transcriptional regulator